MSILSEYYKIEETPVVSSGPLLVPKAVFFSLDFSNISKEDNFNTSVFWNFGNHDSDENERVIPTSSNSIAKHTYTHFGKYHIHCIANVNGTLLHHECDIHIDNTNNDLLFGNNQSILFGDLSHVNYE